MSSLLLILSDFFNDLRWSFVWTDACCTGQWLPQYCAPWLRLGANFLLLDCDISPMNNTPHSSLSAVRMKATRLSSTVHLRVHNPPCPAPPSQVRWLRKKLAPATHLGSRGVAKAVLLNRLLPKQRHHHNQRLLLIWNRPHH